MPELYSIPTTSSVNSPAGQAVQTQETVQAQEALQVSQAKQVEDAARAREAKAKQAADERGDARFEIKRYTARYRMDAGQLNIQILDSDGRLVRTVPPNELLRALQGEFKNRRLDWQG